MSEFSKLQAGDIIKTSRTLKVTSVSDIFVYLEDVQNGQTFAQRVSDVSGTLRFEMVQKAPKKYQVGDVISLSDYEAVPNGTMVALPSAGNALVRNGNGDWVYTKSGGIHRASGLSAPRTIVYLPE